MARRYGLLSLVLLLCVGFYAAAAQAQWVKNGVLVSGAENQQIGQKIISDGADGAVIIWTDYRNNWDPDLYGNRIDGEGNVLGGWGVPICMALGYQGAPDLILDGTGGGIVVWEDDRDNDGYNDIYAQRVDGEGIPRWTENGLPISTEIYSQSWPRIVPDAGGGAIVVWGDYRKGQCDIYAQRLTIDGDTLWPANGMPIDTAQGDQQYPVMVSDGFGGAIIFWHDTRSGQGDLYAQRIDGDGNILWGDPPVPICLVGAWPSNLQVVAVPGGGAICVWDDSRSGYSDIYAQKVDLDGNVLWTTDGVRVCPGDWYNKSSAQMTEDGSGGAIIAWYDERSYYEVYAQRIASDGSPAWIECGVRVFPTLGECEPRIVSDAAGGAIVALDAYWNEEGYTDISAQRIDHDGNLLWGEKGAAICTAEYGQYCPILMPDGLGGAIIAWEDYRVDNNTADIYCQRVGASGFWGDPSPEIISCLDMPEDQGGWVRIKTRASSQDAGGDPGTAIMGYNVWRMIGGSGGPEASSAGVAAAAPASSADGSKILPLLFDPSTASGVRVNGPLAASLGLPEGDWESVGFWFATRDTVYNIAVPTKNDSTEAGIPWETFIVTAHSSIAGLFAASEPVQGYSIDNLAPGMTPGLEGNETESPHGLAVTWTSNVAPDMWKYDVHRGDNDLFVPDESNRIGSTDGTYLFDAEWLKINQYFYKLVAVDRHGNAGPPALLRPEDINVGTALQSFAAALSGSVAEVSWTLAEVDETAAFLVLRSIDGGAFAEISGAAVARNGATCVYRDATLDPGTTYRYRIDVADETGRRTLFETDAIATPAMPLALHQNHPNPFNPSTTISYYLPSAGTVTLDVYDSSGKLVTRLVDRAAQQKGSHSVEWRGVDSRGSAVSSGVYFYRLATGRETLSRKMVLLK